MSSGLRPPPLLLYAECLAGLIFERSACLGIPLRSPCHGLQYGVHPGCQNAVKNSHGDDHLMHGESVSFEPVSSADAEELIALRIAAMRPSLERLGRFDPQRARDRFLANFDPAHTKHLVVDGQRIGFVVIRPQPGHLLLDHLYVAPGHQGKGIGTATLAAVLNQADNQKMPVRVGALRESDSNRFYARHGFELVEETEWDNYYVRWPRG
jgi:GNAT superfamily N-acetyltransferase